MLKRMLQSGGGLAVLAVACLAIAGCGGGSEEALTKTEFIKQGNAICDQATKAREKVISEVSEETNPKGNVEAAQEAVIHKGIPTYEKAAEELDGLAAPAGDEKKVEAIVAAMEEAANRALADPHTAIISDLPFRKADKLAEGYGLKSCVI